MRSGKFGISMNEDTLTEALNVAAIVALLNHKFAVNYDNEDKAEVLTEVLTSISFMT